MGCRCRVKKTMQQRETTGQERPFYALRRASGGSVIEGRAAGIYVPVRRGRAAHFADSFSRSLWLAKKLPDFGAAFAWRCAEELILPILPAGFSHVASPPQGRPGLGRYYLARELAVAVATLAGLRLCEPLYWAGWREEASKDLVHHRGKGRALGRKVECAERLDGARVLLIDDLWTTGITAAQCAEALRQAGAAEVYVVTLAVTQGAKLPGGVKV